MTLRFDQHRPDHPPRSPLGGVPLRLVSLVLGLVLVVVMMQQVRSPEAKRRLAVLFGDQAPGAEENAPAPAQLPDYPPGVDRELLVTVEDNTTFRDQEQQAWFHLLEVARDTRAEELRGATAGPVSMAQLLEQPEVYRGRVVTLEGAARRVEVVRPGENSLGIDRLYRVMVQPSPYVPRACTVYCLRLPAGWSDSAPLPEDPRVRVDGLFFKNWVFDDELGVDVSPVLLAASIVPLARPTSASDTTAPAAPGWMVVGGAALLAVLLVAWITWRGKSNRPSRPATDPSEVRDALRALTTDPAAEQRHDAQ